MGRIRIIVTMVFLMTVGVFSIKASAKEVVLSNNQVATEQSNDVLAQDSTFNSAVQAYPQFLANNYSGWAGFVAELDTVYKYSDNIYFVYSKSTANGEFSQSKSNADTIAVSALVADGCPLESISFRQCGWPGSGAGTLPQRADTGNGYHNGFEPGETVYRFIYCGLGVDPIIYNDIPFVGYHWNGYNFCFEAKKYTTEGTEVIPDISKYRLETYCAWDGKWHYWHWNIPGEKKNIIYLSKYSDELCLYDIPNGNVVAVITDHDQLLTTTYNRWTISHDKYSGCLYDFMEVYYEGKIVYADMFHAMTE